MKVGEEVMAPTPGAARRMQEISLGNFRSDELIEELGRRRSALAPEQRTKILAVAMDMCGECVVLVTRYFPTQGYTFMQYARRMLWKYLRAWPHGNGCPKEAVKP